MSPASMMPILTAVSVLAAPGTSAVAVADRLPQPGCYERVYDVKHLTGHKGQFVRKITLELEPLRPDQLASGHGDIVINADLGVRVKGHKPIFASFGACRVKDGGYDCTGHNLANEHRTCAESTPGVHDCRTPGRVNGFRLEAQPEGVRITIPDGLMLDASDTGPYLNLMASDRENSAFLIGPGTACR